MRGVSLVASRCCLIIKIGMTGGRRFSDEELHENVVSTFNVAASCGDLLGAAQVAPVVGVCRERNDRFAGSRQTQVNRNDREDSDFRHRVEDPRGDDVNPRERARPEFAGFADLFEGAVEAGAATAEAAGFVEEQVARGRAVLHCEGREGSAFVVVTQHRVEVDVAENVDIVEKERLVGRTGAGEEVRGLFQTASGVEKDIFTRDLDVHPEVVMQSEIFGNLVGEVMGVDDDIDDAAGFEASQRKFEQRVARQFNEGLGAVVG
jgi:hypothetical protein